MKKIIVLIVLVIIGVGSYFYFTRTPDAVPAPQKEEVKIPEPPVTEVTKEVPPVEKVDTTKTVIGKSTEGNNITAYHFGTGKKELLFVGGVHGGYEWNTVLVAYQLMDYLAKNPTAIPENLKITVIPVLNPDGLNKTVGTTSLFTKADVPTPMSKTVSGRFNANNVDLNRNFDCDWKESGVWQDTKVSGGSKAFSEPESQAIKAYVETHSPSAVVAWFSAAGGVYASNCHDGVLPETTILLNTFAKASGYRAYEDFDFYAITGDMMNWLAKEGTPAISIVLTTHDDTEWTKNLAGIQALFKHYAE